MIQHVRIRLRDVRQQRGISLRELSRRSGLPECLLSRLETGVARLITIRELATLAEVLEVAGVDLFEAYEPEQRDLFEFDPRAFPTFAIVERRMRRETAGGCCG